MRHVSRRHFRLSNAEAVAVRIEASVAILARVSKLSRWLIGNLTMLERSTTVQAQEACWYRVLELSEAIGLLLPRLQGEIGAAPWHLDAIQMRDLHLRLIDQALKHVTVNDTRDVQALLDRLAFAGEFEEAAV